MFTVRILFVALVLQGACCAQAPVQRQQLQDVLVKTLHHIGQTQFLADSDSGFANEWHSVMKLNVRFPLMGKPKEYADANCFTTASIHNGLAEIYLADTTAFYFLKPSINKAWIALQNYSDGQGYSFWRTLPVHFTIKRKDSVLHIKQPLTYKLKTGFMKNAANVPNDADDTALGIYAELLQQKINGTQTVHTPVGVFFKYRDKDRKNRNWYNHWVGDARNKGAFMTWLWPEVHTKQHNAIHNFIHNIFFYMPWSMCYPHQGRPYVPYGRNDIDAVVNANVLTALAATSHTDSVAAISEAAAFIHRKFKKKQFKHAAIYYPNRFHLHQAVVRAARTGIKQLDSTVYLAVEDIKAAQTPDGSFQSKKRLNQGDAVQSTANALYVLALAGNTDVYKTRQTINRAITFLLSQMQTDSNGNYYWPGGVFFSGGTLVKNILQFKSSAYTSMLIARSLQLVLSMPEE